MRELSLPHGEEAPMIQMIVSFVRYGDTLTLDSTRFRHPLLVHEVVAVRGARALATRGTFRWSSGVRALTSLLVRHAIAMSEIREGASHDVGSAFVEGEDESPAASLDYALSKQPLWLSDMFGVSKNGSPLTKLLFRRINPDRKRAGPVVVFIANKSFAVRVEVNGTVIEGGAHLRRVAALLEAQERTRTQPHK